MQEDIYKNKYDWKEELLKNIEKIKENEKIQNIYMCKSNEYQRYLDIDWNYINNANKIIKKFYIKYVKNKNHSTQSFSQTPPYLIS